MNDTPAERGAEGWWVSLRRRKVVQWGVAYAAGAWLLMQVLEYFSGTFDWPRQIRQLSTLALLIGLPIVLVLAWYHGDRGEQRIRGTELRLDGATSMIQTLHRLGLVGYGIADVQVLALSGQTKDALAERDMARQRAALAARPKDAPLELADKQ